MSTQLANVPYNSSREAARILLENRDGFTLIRDVNVSLDKDTGYLVGAATRNDSLVLPGDADDHQAAGLIARWVDAQPRPLGGAAQYIGIWTDSDTGKMHLDVSDWWELRVEAEAVGIVRKQIAIWDCKNSKEIRL